VLGSIDQAYLRDMVKVHDADGAAFAKEAETGSNPKLRSFAPETHRIVLSYLDEFRGAAQVRYIRCPLVEGPLSSRSVRKRTVSYRPAYDIETLPAQRRPTDLWVRKRPPGQA
jgi:hypothetical protein